MSKKINSKQITLIIGVSIFIVLAVVIGIVTPILVSNIRNDSTISIEGDILTIDGGYGAEIKLTDAEVVMLKALPVLTRRNDG